jgi:hypothetical protein
MTRPKLGSNPFAPPTGVNALIQDTRGSTHSNMSNKETHSNLSNTSTAGLPSGWKRATFIVWEPFLEKLKNVAYWEREDIKDILHEALDAYLSGKEVNPRPKKKSIPA